MATAVSIGTNMGSSQSCTPGNATRWAIAVKQAAATIDAPSLAARRFAGVEKEVCSTKRQGQRHGQHQGGRNAQRPSFARQRVQRRHDDNAGHERDDQAGQLMATEHRSTGAILAGHPNGQAENSDHTEPQHAAFEWRRSHMPQICRPPNAQDDE
jgi:hypothetical protein